jgi:hypothetical protein
MNRSYTSSPPWHLHGGSGTALLYTLPSAKYHITFLKTQRLRLAGRVVGMEEDNPVKKLTFQKSFGSRRKGRPKLRWICDFHVTVFCVYVKIIRHANYNL